MGFHSNIRLQEDSSYINLRISVSSHMEIFHWVPPKKLLIGQIRAHWLAPPGALLGRSRMTRDLGWGLRSGEVTSGLDLNFFSYQPYSEMAPVHIS